VNGRIYISKKSHMANCPGANHPDGKNHSLNRPRG